MIFFILGWGGARLLLSLVGKQPKYTKIQVYDVDFIFFGLLSQIPSPQSETAPWVYSDFKFMSSNLFRLKCCLLKQVAIQCTTLSNNIWFTTNHLFPFIRNTYLVPKSWVHCTSLKQLWNLSTSHTSYVFFPGHPLPCPIPPVILLQPGVSFRHLRMLACSLHFPQQLKFLRVKIHPPSYHISSINSVISLVF